MTSRLDGQPLPGDLRTRRRPASSLLPWMALGWIYVSLGAVAFVHGSLPHVTQVELLKIVRTVTEGDKDVKEAEIVSVGYKPPPGETEVLSQTGSRPAKLLYSPGVQQLLNVFIRLKDAKGPNGKTAFEALLFNLGPSIDAERDIAESWSTDLNEALAVLPAAVQSFQQDFREPLRQFGRLRLAKRLPEIVDDLIPWDIFYPQDLVRSSGIPQADVRGAFRAFAGDLDISQLATWTDAEFDEIDDLTARNSQLKALRDKVVEAISEALDGTVRRLVGTAAAVTLVPIALLVLALIGCCSCLGLFGGGASTAPPVAQSGIVPLLGKHL